MQWRGERSCSLYLVYSTYWCQVSGTPGVYTAAVVAVVLVVVVVAVAVVVVAVVHTYNPRVKFVRAHGVLLILKKVIQAVRTLCICK